MFSRSQDLAKTDPELIAAIRSENRRQEDHIELIASENWNCGPPLMPAKAVPSRVNGTTTS